MKTSTKFISIILAVMMIIAVIPISASAIQPSLTIKVNNTEPNVGDSIIVDVYISDNSGIGALTVDLCYDSSCLETTSIKSYGLFGEINRNEIVNRSFANGKARFTGAKANVVTEGGKLFTVEFKVLKNAQSELSLLIDEATDNDYQNVVVTTNKVSINPTQYIGDVNGDGGIKATDARILQQNICGLKELSESIFIRGDVNKDNSISVIDARLILQCVAGLIDSNMNYKPGNTPLLNTPSICISTNSKGVNIGDVITVTVNIPENSGISGITGDICFDSNAFKVISMTNSSGMGIVNKDYSNGKARFCTVTENSSIDGGIICTLELEIIDTENTNISLDIVDAIDDDYDPVSVITNEITFCSEHSFTEWEVVEEANCYIYGSEIRSCTYCGHIENREIPLTSCNYIEVSRTLPTCLEKGFTTYICIYCENCHDGNYVNATGHNYTWYTISIATCVTDGVMIGECSVCGDIDLDATPKLGHDFVDGICNNCGTSESGNNGGNTGEDVTEPDTPDEPENVDYKFNIKTPSTTSINHKDGIILYAQINGNTPDGTYVEWTFNNDNFKTTVQDNNSLKIISDKNGTTTFTATLYSADGDVLATDTIEMKSKAGFFDKIGSFFRSIFGGTKIYEN
ncbi:MAG: hypothetical protein IKC45_00155 [Clostridia bacterium]|nr:hypothetical protein [Clostridia bacterium]